ncbi:INSulin related [Caenorhabditis elegans]|uniref:INSulin related n=1 Tax=Caenorhabditis elegans TaxID=6239 RepID=Q7JP82_CAEEL|nr:INSulin related [Caenorhabditis elegans]CCD71045.1 INSulin related [Caenorhabditis elegans]|eukprot:NP_001022153.1 INSulin related [Caenorhabditis elegans]
MLTHLKFLLLVSLFINFAVSSEDIKCDAKFISRITKLCIHGITEDKLVRLLTRCCTSHCSKAHLKMFCTLKPHEEEPHHEI